MTLPLQVGQHVGIRHSQPSPIRIFVVISGLPGSGKTTVARALAPLMNLPAFDKDEILERLFESRGIGDAVWRRQLSREADEILEAEVSASAGAIVSSFWHVKGMAADSGTPTEWLAALGGMLVQVHCDCPPAIAADRFVGRARHAGHLDAATTPSGVRAGIEALTALGRASIGPCVTVDTTHPIVPEAVRRDVETALRRGSASTEA